MNRCWISVIIEATIGVNCSLNTRSTWYRRWLASRLVWDRVGYWLELSWFYWLDCLYELARARQIWLELFAGSARAGPSWLASSLAPRWAWMAMMLFTWWLGWEQCTTSHGFSLLTWGITCCKAWFHSVSLNNRHQTSCIALAASSSISIPLILQVNYTVVQIW
jgi:hypothetical protein